MKRFQVFRLGSGAHHVQTRSRDVVLVGFGQLKVKGRQYGVENGECFMCRQGLAKACPWSRVPPEERDHPSQHIYKRKNVDFQVDLRMEDYIRARNGGVNNGTQLAYRE
jgi:hypothetical protein